MNRKSENWARITNPLAINAPAACRCDRADR